MMRRFLLIGLTFLCLFIAAGIFVLSTEQGLRAAVYLISRISGGTVMITGSQGRLLDEWRLAELVVELPAVHIEVGEVVCRWQPAALSRGLLAISDLRLADVVVVPEGQEDAGLDGTPGGAAIALPKWGLPVAVTIDRLMVNRLTLAGDSEDDDFSINSLAARLRVDRQRIAVEGLAVDHTLFSAALDGTMEPMHDWQVSLSGRWSVRPAACVPLHGVFAVEGPLLQPEVAIRLEQPVPATLEGQLANLDAEPVVKLTLTGERIDVSKICPDWPAVTTTLTASVDGGLKGYNGRLSGNVSVGADGLPVIDADLPFSGDQSGLKVDGGRLATENGHGALSAAISWRDGFDWLATGSLAGFDPGRIETALSGQAEALFVFQGRVADERFSWKAEMDRLHFRSDRLNRDFDGTIRADGREDGMSLSGDFKAGGGRATINSTVSWAEGLDWQGRLEVDKLDPAALSESLPSGWIDAVIASSGRVAEGVPVHVHAAFERLDGELSNYRLSGGGAVSYADDQLQIDDLQITTGGNRLAVSGRADDQFDFQIEFAGPQLNRLFPLLQGSAAFSGRLSGTREAPALSGTVSGSELSFGEYSMVGLSGGFHFDSTPRQNLDLHLQARGLAGNGITIDRIDTRVNGSVDEHRADLSIAGMGGTIKAVLTGNLAGWTNWSGRLASIELLHPAYGAWRQKGAAAGSADGESAAVDGLCLTAERSSFCLSGAWNRSGQWSASLGEMRVALADLQRWGMIGTSLSGSVTGELAVVGSGMTVRQLNGRLSAPEIAAGLDTGGMYRDLRWFNNDLTVQMIDSGLSVDIASRFMDGGSLSGHLEVGGLDRFDADFGRLPVNGQLLASGFDLRPLAVLTDDYMLPSGRISSVLTVAGVLGAPVLSGSIVLQNGQLEFPELGSSLAELHGNTTLSGNRLVVELDGRCAAGGRAHGTGSLVFGGDDWHGDFLIDGNSCAIVDQSEMRIVADPHVRLTIDGNGGVLKGTVRIGEALIRPEEMQDSISPSTDVVFVDTSRPESSWSLLFDLDVDLGEQVRVEGYGLNARLAGSIAVSERVDTGLAGRGTLTIEEGTFALYGRPLQIVRGRILFTGGLIDNPELDVVAQKIVKTEGFGREEAVVGVKVSGNTQHYLLELFSQPAMAENDIVAYLLLDKPIASENSEDRGLVNEAIKAVGFSSEGDILGDISGFLPIDDMHLEGSADNGGASLVLGKRLTEDLSISYDFNLFEHNGFFRVRYEFGRGFAVQSRNSFESNGVELLYSLER